MNWANVVLNDAGIQYLHEVEVEEHEMTFIRDE